MRGVVNVKLLSKVNSNGNISLLDEPLTALVCSNRCPGKTLSSKPMTLRGPSAMLAFPSSVASKRR